MKALLYLLAIKTASEAITFVSIRIFVKPSIIVQFNGFHILAEGWHGGGIQIAASKTKAIIQTHPVKYTTGQHSQ